MFSSKARLSLFSCLCITVLCLGCVEARPGNAFQPRSIAFETPYLSVTVRGGSERSAEEDIYYSQRRNPKYGLEQSEQEYYRQDGKYNTDDDRYFDREYDDRGGFEPSPPTPVVRATTESIQNMSKLLKNGNRKIGLPMLAAGAVFTVLGVSLFFNKSLLRLGNILFIAGVPITIGPGRTAGYFFQPKKSRATGCLAFGIFLVLVGWPVFGIVLEIFGLLNLFGNMFPIVIAMLKQMPVIGPILKGNGDSGRSKRRREEYYSDDGYGRRDEQYYDGEDNQRYDDREDHRRDQYY